MPDTFEVLERVRARGITFKLPPWACIIAFSLAGVFLAILQLGPVGLVAFSGLVVVFAYIERRRLIANVDFRVVLFLLVFGLLSVTWSVYPKETLYYGGQIVITALGGAIIASSAQPYESLKGAAIALICQTTCSHIFGHYVPWEDGQVVFVGIVGAKNYYGGLSGLTLLISLGLAYAALTRNEKIVTLIALAGALLGAWGLVRSKAMGFTLSAAACGTIIIYFNVYRVLSNRVRFGMNLYIIYAAVCTFAVLLLVRENVFQFILQMTHKDITLTGRTEIWEVAQESIRKHFWLGTGQNAFWVPGNPIAERIWSSHGVAMKKGFTLHNTFYELMVSLGVIGTILTIGALLVLLGRQAYGMLRYPTTLQITWLAISLFFVLLSAVESFILAPVNYATFFMVCALTFSPPRAPFASGQKHNLV